MARYERQPRCLLRRLTEFLCRANLPCDVGDRHHGLSGVMPPHRIHPGLPPALFTTDRDFTLGTGFSRAPCQYFGDGDGGVPAVIWRGRQTASDQVSMKQPLSSPSSPDCAFSIRSQTRLVSMIAPSAARMQRPASSESMTLRRSCSATRTRLVRSATRRCRVTLRCQVAMAALSEFAGRTTFGRGDQRLDRLALLVDCPGQLDDPVLGRVRGFLDSVHSYPPRVGISPDLPCPPKATATRV